MLDTREHARVAGTRGGVAAPGERELTFRAPSVHIHLRVLRETDGPANIQGQYLGPETILAGLTGVKVSLRAPGRRDVDVLAEPSGEFTIACLVEGLVEVEFDSSCGPRIRTRFVV